MNGVLDSFDVAAAEALYLAAELEVTADGRIVEHPEAVDDGDGAAGHGEHLIGVELPVGIVADGQDDGIGALEGRPQVRFYPELRHALLVPEI